MKKQLAMIALAALGFLVVSAYSQVTVEPGAVIGIGSFWVTSSGGGESSSSDSRTGFLAGGVLDIGFSHYLSLEPGIQYSGRGGKSSSDGVNETDEFDYLAIPINLKVKYPVTPVISPYVLAGINVGFLLGASSTVTEEGVTTTYSGTSGLNTLDFGFDLGVGSEFHVGNIIPFVDLGWYIGVANISSDASSGYSSTNHGFEVKAGIKFKT